MEKLKNKRSLFIVLGSITIIIVWIILTGVIGDEIILPRLSMVLKNIYLILTKSSNLLVIGSTLLRLLISIIIAFGLSFILLIISIYNQDLIYLFKPVITILKTTPVAAIIIILLIWCGSEKSPLIITALIIFPIMVESFMTGLTSIEKGYIEELKLNGENLWFSVFKVYIPMISQFIFMGLIQSIGLGLKVMVTAELISQTPNSIGRQLNLEKISLETSNLFAWSLILIIITVIVEVIISRIKKKLT